MGIVSNYFSKKIIKSKQDRFKEDIDNLIKEAESYNLELYRLNNRLKTSLLNCNRLSDLFKINIEQYQIPYKYTQEIDISSDESLDGFRVDAEMTLGLHNAIYKCNKIICSIREYNRIINQYRSVVNDVKCYIEDKEIQNSSNTIIKFGLDKNRNLVCTLCDFGSENIVRLRSLNVAILYGNFHRRKDYGTGMGHMKLGVQLFGSRPSIDIGIIDVRAKVKRVGIGSFTLRYLEEVIIPELNRRSDKFNSEPKSEDDDVELRHIKEIHGCSGDLSSDTDSKARERFYTKNGDIIDGVHFRKTLDY